MRFFYGSIWDLCFDRFEELLKLLVSPVSTIAQAIGCPEVFTSLHKLRGCYQTMNSIYSTLQVASQSLEVKGKPQANPQPQTMSWWIEALSITESTIEWPLRLVEELY